MYIAPGLLVFAAFVLTPLVHAVWLSFFAWDGITAPSWVGLGNYQRVAGDPAISEAFTHSAMFFLFYSLLPISLGLILAALMTRVPLRGLSTYRVILFLPQVLSVVVIATSWRWMYDTDGIVNSILRLVGLGDLARAWLGDFDWALPALGLVGTWIMTPLTMILFLAGIQRIPASLYDAARVDGAGPVAEFWAVTFPGLRNEITVALVITAVAALRSFALVYVATRGGPGHSTTVPALWIYSRAFESGEVGYAAAIGVVLAAVIISGSFLIFRFMRSS